MRVLLVEDDPIVGDAVVQALRGGGYAVDWVRDGNTGDIALRGGEFDLVLLDLGLPKLPGVQLLKRLRERKNRVPVLILTAQGSVQDRVAGLDAGADDYLAKPFELAELEARVRALIRRSHGSEVNCLQCGPLSFDTSARQAAIDGAALELSPREISVLEVLMLRAGRLVSKEQMVEHLYGWGEEVSTNAIEVYVHRLRKKVEPHVNIITVRGLGYWLEKPAATSTK